MSNVQTELPSPLAAWKKCYDQMDFTGLVELYDTSAWFKGTSVPKWTQGRAGVREYFASMSASRVDQSVDFSNVNTIRDTGDEVTYIGNYVFNAILMDGTKKQKPGTFSMTFGKSADGGWKVTDHISAMDPPQP
jgi:ketosteroid isomerase-like protein